MLYVSLFLWCILSVTLAADKPCTLQTNDGKYYDLNPLATRQDYKIPTPRGEELILNVCKSVTTETWNTQLPNGQDEGVVAGFIRRERGDFTIGTVNTTITSSTEGLSMLLSNGSPCKSVNSGSSQYSAAFIMFTCDTSFFDSGLPKLMGELPGQGEDACAYFIEWKTSYACPTSKPGGLWGFISFLLKFATALLILYLALGTLYNRYVLQLRGFDQIPQFSIVAFRHHAENFGENVRPLAHDATERFGPVIGRVVEWFKDLMGHMYEGGQSRSVRLPQSAGGIGRTNPISHQTNVGIPVNTPQFVRPHRNSTINPVSHQSQALQDREMSDNLPTSKGKGKAEKGTEEEREFLVGSDDEDDEGEVGLPNHDLTQIDPSTAPNDTVLPASPASPDTNNNDAAAKRGRVTDDGIIRL